jgi:MFS family permease
VSATATSPPLSGTARRDARLAISLVFLANGLLLGSWVSRIPAIAGDLDLSSGLVGLALMALAAGAIIAFPLSGRTIDTRSSATATIGFLGLMLVALPLVGVAPALALLLPALLLLGAGNGGVDVAMNAQGVEVEKAYGAAIMSSLHGCFSVGTFAAAGLGAAMAFLGVHPLPHFLVVSLVALAVLLWARPRLIPDAPSATRESGPAPTFAFPPRALWLLGALAFCAAVSEGAMADWSGLYLDDYLDTGEGFAAFGYAAFSATMLLGRFTGDALTVRFGAERLIRVGGVVAAVGLGIAVAINTPAAMLVGFAAVGLGLATVYPLVFSAAGNHPVISQGRAVAAVATVGYTGFLAAPPVLGWVAEPTSLRVVMAIVVVLALCCALLARAARSADAHATTPGDPTPHAAREPLS